MKTKLLVEVEEVTDNDSDQRTGQASHLTKRMTGQRAPCEGAPQNTGIEGECSEGPSTKSIEDGG